MNETPGVKNSKNFQHRRWFFDGGFFLIQILGVTNLVLQSTYALYVILNDWTQIRALCIQENL